MSIIVTSVGEGQALVIALDKEITALGAKARATAKRLREAGDHREAEYQGGLFAGSIGFYVDMRNDVARQVNEPLVAVGVSPDYFQCPGGCGYSIGDCHCK